jgi:Arc/MetJ-type ribon-helix-helix transcriptional regulator
MAESKGSEKVTLKIPRPLYEKLQQIIPGTGYSSVTEFVVYVLRDLAATHELAEAEPYSEAELVRVKERLRSLGYL